MTYSELQVSLGYTLHTVPYMLTSSVIDIYTRMHKNILYTWQDIINYYV